jgi:hypothetical protein
MNSPDRAVRFGEYGRIGFNYDAFPFIYNFVHSRDDTWSPGGGKYTNMNGVGVLMANTHSGLYRNKKSVYIQLDSDANFLMKGIKLTPYTTSSNGADTTWRVTQTTSTAAPYMTAGYFWDYIANPQTSMEQSALRYIQMKVYDHTTGHIIFDPNNPTTYTDVFGYPNKSWGQNPFQGNHYGEGQVYTQYLFAKDGTIRIDLEYTWPVSGGALTYMLVGGMVFGWKVRY